VLCDSALGNVGALTRAAFSILSESQIVHVRDGANRIRHQSGDDQPKSRSFQPEKPDAPKDVELLIVGAGLPSRPGC